MKTRTTILAVICCLSVFGCSDRASNEAARISAAGSWDMSTNNFADAYRKFQRAAELRPDVAAYHVSVGLAAAKLGKQQEAVKQYSIAEDILSREALHNPDRVVDEAMVLVLLGRTADATQALKEGAERFPDSPDLQRVAYDPDPFIAGVQQLGSAEPDGAANESQPSSSDTNRTSEAAGSRR